VEFVRFYLEEAGALAKDVGYIAMTKEEYAAQMEKFNKFVADNK
jgi:phosphate transport system substrate-binding protein